MKPKAEDTNMNIEQQEKIKEKVMDVDELLEDVWKFGRYQYAQYLWIGLPIVFVAMMNANYIFAAEDIDYRCTVPECDTSNSSVMVPTWWPNFTDHRCGRPVFDQDFNDTIPGVCSSDMFINNTDSCTEWTYSTQNSIVEAFNMACKPWMRTLVGTIHNVGMLVSMPLLGFVSDRFGRKLALIVSAVGGGGLGVLKTFALNYYMYLTFEFLEATIGAAVYTSAFVLLVELGGKEKRVVSAAYVGSCITLGEIIFALVAQAVPYWKTMIQITYTPCLLFIMYIFLLSESIRWQLTNGNKKEAKENILKAAKCNGFHVSEEQLIYFEKAETPGNTDRKQKPIQVKDLFSSTTILKRLAISAFWWLSASFIYYGLMINSVGLPGNKYVNFILTAAAALPGDIASMFALNIFGRKKTLMFAFIFCGICCVASGFIPESLWWLSLVVFLLGKMSIAACFNGIYIYSSELFPTNMRTSLMGCCSMFARIGSIAAPQTPLLVAIMPSLPLILFGAFAAAAGLLMLLTPETLNTKLPDTVDDLDSALKR